MQGLIKHTRAHASDGEAARDIVEEVAAAAAKLLLGRA